MTNVVYKTYSDVSLFVRNAVHFSIESGMTELKYQTKLVLLSNLGFCSYCLPPTLGGQTRKNFKSGTTICCKK